MTTNAVDLTTETLVAEFKTRFPAAYRLAVCASLAARVEPELLRALRFELLPGTDAGAEADVWLSPLVAYRSAVSLEFDRGVCGLLRQELALPENHSLLEAAHRVVARLHERMPSALKAEEEITWLALAGGETTSAQINAILQSVIATMATDTHRRLDIARWAAGGLQRLPAEARSSDAARSVGFAAGTLLKRPQLLSALPGSGATWSALAAVLPPDLGEETVGIQLIQGGVEITDPSSAAHKLIAPRTTPVVLEITWRRDDTRWSQVVGWEPGQSRQVMFPSEANDPAASITVRTINGKVFSLRASGVPQRSAPSITLGPTPRRTRTRRALLVGINHYAHLPGLQGCAEDAAEIGRFLREQLDWNDVRILVDSEATADSIRRAFSELLSAGQIGEIWVYYAGHGRTGTVNGLLDFELFASDATGIQDGNARGVLHAAELAQYLMAAAVNGSRVTVILDSIGAGPDASGNNWLQRDTRFGDLVVLAASHADQPAYNMALPSGSWTGALTDALLRALQQLSPDEREHATWLHVYPMLRARVEALFPSQTPVLIGRADQPVFGGLWNPDEAGYAVVQTVPGVYTLANVPEYNLRVGDTLEVIAGDPTQSADAARRRLGFLELTDVGLSVATGRAPGTPFELEPGARAYAVRGRATLMRVALVPPSALLQALLDASPLLRAVGFGDPEAQVFVEGSTEQGWLIRNTTEPEVARIAAGGETAVLNALSAYWRYNTVLQLASRPALDFAQYGVTARLVQPYTPNQSAPTQLPLDPVTGEFAVPPDYLFQVALNEQVGSHQYVTVMRCSVDGAVDQLAVAELPGHGWYFAPFQISSVRPERRAAIHHIAVFVSREPLPDLRQLATPATQLAAAQPPAGFVSTDLFSDTNAGWSATLIPLHVGEQYRWDLTALLSAVIFQVGMSDAGALLSVAGISFDLVPGEGKDALIRRIVAAAYRLGTVSTLVTAIRRLFPTVDVDAYQLAPRQDEAPAQDQPPSSEPPPSPATQTDAPVPEAPSTEQGGALDLLRNEDPLDAMTAVTALSENPPGLEVLFAVARGAVSRAAVRSILATRSDQAARAIIERIEASGPTGETWQQASSAASLVSPRLRQFMESELVALISVGPEVSRHALTALGEIGAAGAHATEVLDAMIPAYADKRMSFALDAAARSFELATFEPDIFASADLMVRLDDLRTKLLPSVGNAPPTLRECDVQHIDAALKVFLISSESNVVDLGLSVIENVLDDRALEAAISVATRFPDDDVRRRAVQTVWRLGSPENIAAISRLKLEPTEFGLEYVEDPAYFDSLLRTALDLPQRFMALRAVGLRGRRDHIDLLRAELRGSDALSRGCAALALARLYDQEPVRAAYVSATEPAERVFAALGMLTLHGADYPNLALQLRQDLRTNVVGYLPELQTDILAVLENTQYPDAIALGRVWAPFCFAAARRRATTFGRPQAA